MTTNIKRNELLSKLERLIGVNCFNPSSYNGYTMEYGAYFRYAVTYCDEKGNEYKTKMIVDPEYIMSAKYKFGANQLLIGEALNDVLNYLEEYYGLDIENGGKGND